ncbi:MAG: trypsin-like peptidase domain-containing protein [Rhodospirillaceae bacterium]|nr:trypsin-like peptidase domain-containing protein [Rhodospirillaceae bacterium]
MPKLPSEVLSSVFYLYGTREAAEKGESFGGTGFLVSYPTGLPDGSSFVYGVTNWHVAVQSGASVVRLNKIGGGVDGIELDPADWDFKPQWHDLAVASIPLSQEVHQIKSLGLAMLLSDTDILKYGIGPGDDVFMVGRFVDHDGSESNVTAVRFGNISTMPQSIRQNTGSTEKSFIIDMHSRTGYSGSPLFVYRTIGTDLTAKPLEIGPDKMFLKVLGIHWGQFPELWEIRTGAEPLPHGAEISADSKYVTGMSGMTLAIPAWEIRNLLEMPSLRQQRARTLATIAKS